MKVLVVGGGGREHAIAWKLAAERGVREVVCAPGNAGIADVARLAAIDAGNPEELAGFAEREQIDLTVVGPELPLDRGIADLFIARAEPSSVRRARPRSSNAARCSQRRSWRGTGIPTGACYRVCDTRRQPARSGVRRARAIR